MFACLYPKYYFSTVFDLSAEFFSSIGVKAVIFDIDNTLVPHKTRIPTGQILDYLNTLNGSGIQTAFVSNNNKERVEEFSKKTKSIFFYNSGKPSGKFIRIALKKMNASTRDTAMVGDQLLTDILAANRAGVVSILVDKISDKENIFIKFKRLLEKPFMKKINKIKTRKTKCKA